MEGGSEKNNPTNPEGIDEQKKRMIALKFLLIKYPGSEWNTDRENPKVKSDLSRVAVAADMTMPDLISFLDQMSGQEESNLDKEKQLEIAYLFMKSALRAMVEETGILPLSKSAPGLADDIGISVSDFRMFIKDIFKEQLDTLFPTD